jgi:hypothetical protein
MNRLWGGLALLALAACSPATPSDGTTTGESPASSMTAAEAASLMASTSMADLSSVNRADAYVGKWTGPEGTAMTITPAGDDFDVVIRNLDGPRTFKGTLHEDGLHIERDGKTLVIHSGNGEDTGMKWLADKQTCLVVDANEGYCRD